jgi:hypothetical protein
MEEQTLHRRSAKLITPTQVGTGTQQEESIPTVVNVHTAVNVTGENVASNHQVQVTLHHPTTKSNSVNLNGSASTNWLKLQ